MTNMNNKSNDLLLEIASKLDDNIEKNNTINSQFKNKIPNYLSLNNPIFQQLIQSILDKTGNTISKEDIQMIGFILYEIDFWKLQHLLWNAYLRSGTGEYEQHRQSVNNINVQLWPSEVKSNMIKKKQTTATNINDITQHSCVNYVYKILHQILDVVKQYVKKLELKKQQLQNSFIEEIEDYLMEYVERYELCFQRISNDQKIAIVQNNFKNYLIELEFLQLQPNPYQMEKFLDLIQLKKEQLKSQYDLAMLKHEQLYHVMPQSIQALQLPSLPSSYNTIIDENNRQDISEQYHQILQRTQSDLQALHIKIGEIKMEEYQVKLNTILNQMKHPQERLTIPFQLRFNAPMMYILEQCFQNLNEHYEHLFNLKKAFVEKKTFLTSLKLKEFLEK